MKRLLIGLMAAFASQAAPAQTDLHSHMIPASYLETVKAHGMEMDEGFPIPAWFSRLFKRETGLTPGEFRRQFNNSHISPSNPDTKPS